MGVCSLAEPQGARGKSRYAGRRFLLLGGRCEGPWVRKEQVSALLSVFILKYDHQFFLGLRDSLERAEGKEESFLFCSY